MDCCKAVELPAWERDRLCGLSTQQHYDWLFDLFKEGVDITVMMYGECTVRTHGTRSPNNTPLMLLSEAKPLLVDQDTYVRMIDYLVNHGRGGLSLVDNHRENAFTIASRHCNYAFIKWALECKDILAEGGFNCEATNDAGRNESLASIPNITILDQPIVAGEPGRQGGESDVHRRHRRQAVAIADDASQWVLAGDGNDPEWCISE